MDWSTVSAITTSISAARDIAKGLAATRDQALINEKTSALLEQLLKAQEGLLSHNAALLQLQGEHFEASEKLRKLEEAARERGRYTLVDLGGRRFAYRMNICPQTSGLGEPSNSEPLHYVCQPCFDKGIKSVLQSRLRAPGLECTTCGLELRVEVASLYES